MDLWYSNYEGQRNEIQDAEVQILHLGGGGGGGVASLHLLEGFCTLGQFKNRVETAIWDIKKPSL